MFVLDLCAGTGSATQAFKDRGHDVETLDIVGEHTYVCDVRAWHPEKHYDFIWMSPPCTDFSIAKAKKGVRCIDRKVDLSIVRACLRIVQEAKPQYWIMENPRGCLRHFIGMPTTTIEYSDYYHPFKKPTDLWGVFPFFWSTSKRMPTINMKRINMEHSENGRRIRAQVPYGLSLAICKALEREYSVLL